MANYGTVVGGDTYFASRLHAWDWENASAADKAKALTQATELIDQFDYVEQKFTIAALGSQSDYTAAAWEAAVTAANIAQPLEFPRGDSSTIPDPIIEATYLIAQALLSGRDPEQDLENQTLKVARMGQLSSQRDVEGNTMEHLAHLIPSPLAWNKIRPFLRERTQFCLNRTR